MDNDLKTIKEIADELGVSKTAINKKVTDDNRKLWFSKIGNKFMVNETGQVAIKSMFVSNRTNQKPQTENHESKTEKSKPQTENKKEDVQKNADFKYLLEIVEYQKEQIEDLKKTKEEHFKQLSSMQNLLDQQQQLALQDKNLLEEYKSEIKSLKSLNLSGDGTEIQRKEAFESKDDVNLQEQPKKWWHLWR